MKCAFCDNDITEEPFIKKEWPSIGESEVYHTQCFAVFHKDAIKLWLSREARKKAIDDHKRQENDTPSAIPD